VSSLIAFVRDDGSTTSVYLKKNMSVMYFIKKIDDKQTEVKEELS
jgi:hypothetical protein